MIENLRKLRVTNGITQQQLAEAIGTSQQSINKYENHGVEPDIGTLIRIADFFHTSVDYLIGHSVSDDSGVSSAPQIDREVAQVMMNYSQLSEKEKASIRMVIQNYLDTKKNNQGK